MFDGEPDAKRRCFLHGPDLKVLIEEEVFNLYSQDLIAASAVFKHMLEAGMRESREGQITLPGKCKEEFRLLLTHVVPVRAAFPDITDESVPVLLKWGDEYQMDGLIARCEEHLIKSVSPQSNKGVIVEHIALAIEYNLEKLKDHCEGIIIRQYRSGSSVRRLSLSS
eukprot:gnl/MRDRNA2_/MRDRNA2_340597_c0_seq1.p2 gnl/MRDRNA2_/MRDRNA2_340597_c0~~gnl/MRDRNA2_/MRDRNA2_340597_c0_seq1.p2  ORF type:complete len:167 (+),score=24.88 gnl/MRDRNA2_/MRDRNA2_340597_c0_seq1:157-657(+)